VTSDGDAEGPSGHEEKARKSYEAAKEKGEEARESLKFKVVTKL